MTPNFLRNLFLIVLSIVSLSGCAMSGGSPVRFIPQNYQEIVLSPYHLSDPYYLSDSSRGYDHSWYLTLQVYSDRKPRAGFLKPNQMVMESFTRWIYGMRPVAGEILVTSENDISSGCQGDFAGQLTQKPDGAFRGQLIFTDYADDCSLVLRGEVPFRGELDMTSGAMTVKFELKSLSALLDKKKLQYGGDLRLEFNAFKDEEQVTTVMSNLSISDESGPRLKLRDMKFTWDLRGEYPQTTMAGMFDYVGQGAVRLTTESPIKILPERGLPFEGALYFHGVDENWVRLAFPKPALTGFYRIDGTNGWKAKGTL